MGKKLLYYFLPIAKLVLFGICFLFFALPVSLLKNIPFIKELNTEESTVLWETCLIFSLFLVLFLLSKMFKPLTFRHFFIVRKDAFGSFLKGTLLGICIMAMCIALLSLIGNVSFMIGGITLGMFFFYIIYFLVVAFFEELLFRTYPLFVFAETYPIALAILFNGLLFGFVHATNPGFTWLAMLNISLAGVLFSMFTLYYRSLSWAIGIHLGWNFAQGILFGFKVSGSNTPSLLSTKPTGVSYISGGEFGIEGSLICTIILVLIITYFFRKHKIAPIVVHKNN
ncbi:MAG TPA: CPBP family intramembrane glutamic endopeptidase [Pedobacter sp.]|nr:CPBP family intramembrane glutamic endopeptidase [Pedobacter sp.]